MSGRKISIKKVGIGVVKANIKLWGGDKVPYLNNSINAVSRWIDDPSSFMKEYKVPLNEQQKIKLALKKIEDYKKENSKLETELNAVKLMYSDLIDKSTVKVLEIVCSSNQTLFKNNILYTITPNLLKRLEISSLKTVNFMDIDRRMTDPKLVQGYLAMIKSMRDMETKALNTLNRLNNSNRSLSSARDEVNRIVENKKKRK